jgi:hypothetical protein
VDTGVALTAYRIVQEALSNTRQHAGRAAARVSLVWTADRLRLAVEDDGRGVLDWPDESGAGGHAQAGPAGHGLQSLRERVQACGGSFRAEPRPGGGFVVTATLPTAPAAADQPPDPPPPRADHPEPVMTIRVLLVDDQPLLRTGFRLILQTEPDIEVVGEAADGEVALAQVRRLRPDVVLMDIRMPGMDGVEATRRLNQLSDPPRVLS